MKGIAALAICLFGILVYRWAMWIANSEQLTARAYTIPCFRPLWMHDTAMVLLGPVLVLVVALVCVAIFARDR